MLRQPEPPPHLPPYMTFRATHREHNVPTSSINRIMNGLADYNLHKQRFLNKVRTNIDKYDYSSEILDGGLVRHQYSSRRSNSLKIKNAETLAFLTPNMKHTRSRLRSLEGDCDIEPYPSLMCATPLKDSGFVGKALQTIVGFRNRT